jgi:hypothetical protein
MTYPSRGMKTVLKPSQLKAATGKILDKAIRRPQYVNRNGVLLVITKADSAANDDLLSPWKLRAKTLASFYDPAKAW